MERDVVLRGFWICGANEMQEIARKTLLYKETSDIFIPDQLLLKLNECYKEIFPNRKLGDK